LWLSREPLERRVPLGGPLAVRVAPQQRQRAGVPQLPDAAQRLHPVVVGGALEGEQRAEQCAVVGAAVLCRARDRARLLGRGGYAEERRERSDGVFDGLRRVERAREALCGANVVSVFAERAERGASQGRIALHLAEAQQPGDDPRVVEGGDGEQHGGDGLVVVPHTGDDALQCAQACEHLGIGRAGRGVGAWLQATGGEQRDERGLALLGGDLGAQRGHQTRVGVGGGGETSERGERCESRLGSLLHEAHVHQARDGAHIVERGERLRGCRAARISVGGAARRRALGIQHGGQQNAVGHTRCTLRADRQDRRRQPLWLTASLVGWRLVR